MHTIWTKEQHTITKSRDRRNAFLALTVYRLPWQFELPNSKRWSLRIHHQQGTLTLLTTFAIAYAAVVGEQDVAFLYDGRRCDWDKVVSRLLCWRAGIVVSLSEMTPGYSKAATKMILKVPFAATKASFSFSCGTELLLSFTTILS